ncbi:hypothetical protein [Burkholderia ubonensis]|uniref:hypothetical protein n=1 Tax=Burkholderia ubonensis TaxID=101571 RepID=UPI0012FC3277|nr:hypothetical protein [Burkholderia ubonensis]
MLGAKLRRYLSDHAKEPVALIRFRYWRVTCKARPPRNPARSPPSRQVPLDYQQVAALPSLPTRRRHESRPTMAVSIAERGVSSATNSTAKAWLIGLHCVSYERSISTDGSDGVPDRYYTEEFGIEALRMARSIE